MGWANNQEHTRLHITGFILCFISWSVQHLASHMIIGDIYIHFRFHYQTFQNSGVRRHFLKSWKSSFHSKHTLSIPITLPIIATEIVTNCFNKQPKQLSFHQGCLSLSPPTEVNVPLLSSLRCSSLWCK